jgi:hypothetical protein
MRLSVAAAALLASSAVTVAAADPATPRLAPDAAATPARGRVTDPDVIARAVRETLAETPPASRRPDGGALRADAASEQFGRQFDEARVPGCLRPDGLRLQPPQIGPIGVGGLLALPFLAVAKLRGKCN